LFLDFCVVSIYTIRLGTDNVKNYHWAVNTIRPNHSSIIDTVGDFCQITAVKGFTKHHCKTQIAYFVIPVVVLVGAAVDAVVVVIAAVVVVVVEEDPVIINTINDKTSLIHLSDRSKYLRAGINVEKVKKIATLSQSFLESSKYLSRTGN